MSGAALARRASTRRNRLIVAAALTLAATLWAALEPDEPATLPTRPRADLANRADLASRGDGAPRTGRPAAIAASSPDAGWPEAPRAGTRTAWPAADPDSLFAWSGPPLEKPSAAASAPAAPRPTVQAPPFPYALIGRLDDGVPRALLAGPRNSLSAKTADLIDGEWRVDAVTPQGVSLTWLPGGIKKTITFGTS